ncbi:MAG TPA: 16S rRNA (adenine(1518)-N(6)/adenine(1519)-N(6))-dimethyltransferase RsmA [Gemmatimonadaceae bacterium]|jgi:16S rRNA (adenine1518-N6/adenine1519-N6)-dimethyltransferase|nr:16S rRNA (adenine(1518)-N(6)/adenine(1519)-N(6))-dimethyltransferase RsmA [Gemmatimonadaceae bacterium]
MPADGGPPARRGSFPPTRKSLGQHFLTDRRILGRIADALHLTGTETVLEIGPGRGALTDILAERAGRLIAIEYDRALAEMLRQRYLRRSNVLIAEADVLEVSLGDLAAGPYVLVGNVPYYITTPILFHALAPPRADRSVYLVQKEVAQRLSATPGSKEYGALTVNVAAVARAETLFGVAAGAFSPPPKVESAVVRITPIAESLVLPEEERPFRLLVQGAFGMRRKQMRRVVRSLYSVDAEGAEALLAAAGIEPEVRPEVLTPKQFAALMRAARGRPVAASEPAAEE